MNKKWAVVRFQYEEAHRKATIVHGQISSRQLDIAIKYLEHSWTLLSKGEWAKAVTQAESARNWVLTNISSTKSNARVELLIVVLNAFDAYLLQLRGYGAERIKSHVA
jgi:hypothetical protein